MSTVLNIGIEKSKVLLEVGRLTNYIGKKKSAEDGKFETIGAIEADDMMLTQFWYEGTDAIANELKEFDATLASEESDETGTVEGFFSTCQMSDHWDSRLEGKVNGVVMKFLVNYIVARWLMITMDYKDADQYDGVSSKAMSQLIEFLYSTKRPSYTSNLPYNDEDDND